MAMTAAQKKAAQDLIDKANAQKAKLEAQLAALEKQQADAAAAQAAAKAQAQADELAAKKAAREADLAAKAAARRTTTGTTTTTTTDPASLAVKGSGIFQMLGGILYFDGSPFNGKDGGKNYVNGVVSDEVVTDGTNGTINANGISTTGLAIDTFKNTLAQFFGAAEMSKPWVDGLYKSVSSFYKTGSTVDEAFNLALLASRNDPNMKSFTERFKGIYALQDAKAKGGTTEVPTIAEYFATENKMGQVLSATGLNSLNNEAFLGDVIGKGVSVTEFSNRITNVFDRIDQAPAEIKDTLNRFFPSLDRATLATALLTGDQGATQLQKKLSGYEVLAAAENQGIGKFQGIDKAELAGGITEEQAANLAATGQTYSSAMTGFAQVAQAKNTEQKLAEISGQQSMGIGGLTEAVLGKNAARLTQLESLTNTEENRFRGKAGVGTLASSRRNQLF